MKTINDLKDLISKITEQDFSKISLDIPPSNEPGEYSYSVYALSKERRTSPELLASDICWKLTSSNLVDQAVAVKGFVNISLSTEACTSLLEDVSAGGLFPDLSGGQEIMLEYFSPNTNKPIHIGHLRNIFIGEALSNILRLTGFRIIRANLFNDRGIHISKAQAAYKLTGESKTPLSSGKKGDHFVGEYYVMFGKIAQADSAIEDEAKDILIKWESDDKEVKNDWLQMRQWVVDGFNETLNRIGVKPFDLVYYESDFWKEGVVIIKDGLNRNLFQTGNNGSVIIDLGEKGVRPLLRSDGTALYLTQDIYLAKRKFHDYPNLAKSIYIVAAEQNEHFQALFEILGRLGYTWSEKCYHLDYGMILIKGGKLKSREGVTADADSVLDELKSLALNEINARLPELNESDKNYRAEIIAQSAVKWAFLKVNTNSNINFNPKSSLELKGDTGPYLLYTIARIRSVLKKATIHTSENAPKVDLLQSEREIICISALFKDEVKNAAENYNFSSLCHYLYILASKFNNYYQHVRILDEQTNAPYRLIICSVVESILETGLSILGIKTLDKM